MSPVEDSGFKSDDEFEIEENDDLEDEDEDEEEDDEDDEDDEDEESLFAFTLQPPGERYLSLEELEEGYGSEADGPDHDGYTAQERELREVGGVAGMSMDIMAVEMPDPEQQSEEFIDDWDFD